MLFNFYPCHEAEAFARRELPKKVHLSSSDLKDVDNMQCYTAQIADSKHSVTVKDAFADLDKTLHRKYGKSCLCLYGIILNVNGEYEHVTNNPFEKLSELDSDVLEWKIESALIIYIKGVCACSIVV